MVAYVVGACNVLALIVWALFDTGPSFFLVGLIVAVLSTRHIGGRAVKEVIAAIDEPGRELDVLAKVLARLEQEKFEHGRLRNLHAALTTEGTNASACILRLRKLIAAHEARGNQLFAVVALMLMWDVHFAYAFEAWRKRYGANVQQWLDALGELEALCSLAAYHYERTDDPFPEIVEGTALFDGVEIGHPLLSSGACVRNTVRLDDATRVFIVSGSNMSGREHAAAHGGDQCCPCARGCAGTREVGARVAARDRRDVAGAGFDSIRRFAVLCGDPAIADVVGNCAGAAAAVVLAGRNSARYEFARSEDWCGGRDSQVSRVRRNWVRDDARSEFDAGGRSIRAARDQRAL